MSERLSATRGRKVVSRASAEHLGTVSHLVLDARRRAVSLVVVGKRRGARVVAWEDLSGFGTDAVMVRDEAALREPADERERAAARGRLEAVGRRVLSELGNDLGHVEEVLFDPATGAVEAIVVEGAERAGEALLGLGSYALVVRA